MALKKVMQRYRQLGGVIAPPRFSRGPYIVEDHFADALRPTNLMKQIKPMPLPRFPVCARAQR
jgi:hypothetical protein